MYQMAKSGTAELKTSDCEVEMARAEKICLEVSEENVDGDTVAYLKLPGHPGARGSIKKNLRLRDLVGEYSGPELFLDFDVSNTLVGIEILD